ncbi:adenylyltransferase/cytidyltransferase family protein [Candidatus Kaiserbacteria bacterium]|nr:adenylyltransferase/cytidyltransferase family protein [Candidatus Kaiserbacteria bacterium]
MAEKSAQKKPTWVAVSGGFDPLHIGHVRMFEAAKKLGDKLVVILNNDNWLRDKKGFSFMPEKERKEIIEMFPFVDSVVISDHKLVDADRSVVRMLKKIRPAVFANGGDRDKKDAGIKASSLNPEQELCKKLGIKLVFNVGRGGKVQSSSWMIDEASRHTRRSVRPWGDFYGWDSGKTWYVKTIYVKPGKRLSLQYHKNRSERWVLVEGDATAVIIENGKTVETPLKVGETFMVEKGTTHRLTSEKGGILVEVAVGSSFDENDIVRIDDDFGRKS